MTIFMGEISALGGVSRGQEGRIWGELIKKQNENAKGALRSGVRVQLGDIESIQRKGGSVQFGMR